MAVGEDGSALARSTHEVVPPRHLPGVVLHRDEVRYRGGGVGAGDRPDGAGDVVRGDGHAVEVTDGRDAHELAQATALADVGGGDVHRAGPRRVVELRGRHEVLARQDGGRYLVGHAAARVRLLGRYGVLQPREVESVEFPPEATRGLDGEVPVEVHPEVDVVADLVADGLDERHLVCDGLVVESTRRRVDVPGGRHVEVELQRGKPLVDHLARGPSVRLRGVDVAGVDLARLGLSEGFAAVGVTVESDPVAVLPAEEFVDGDAEHLPLDVEARHLDPVERRLSDAPAPRVALVEKCPDAVGVERVLAHEVAREPLDELHEPVRGAVGLADAVDARIGLYLHDAPGEVARESHRPDVGYLDVALRRSVGFGHREVAPRHAAALRNAVLGVFLLCHPSMFVIRYQ